MTLDLGTALAGKTVKIRFRIGTDQPWGPQFGWELEDLEFRGIDNTPFGALVSDATECGGGRQRRRGRQRRQRRGHVERRLRRAE